MTTSRLYVNVLLGILTVVVLLLNTLSYSASSLEARIALIGGFSVLVVLSIFAYKAKYLSLKSVYLVLLALSLLFALWRTNFLSPEYLEIQVNSRFVTFAQGYSQTGSLNLGSAESFFFLPAAIDYFLNLLGCLNYSLITYINFVIYVVFIWLSSVLIVRLVRKKVVPYAKNFFIEILPVVVGILTISMANSERGGPPFVLVTLLLWLIFDGRFTLRNGTISMIILLLGITFGTATGALFLIPFFFIASISSNKSRLFFSFIPLSYFVFSAVSYTLTLKSYTVSAWSGFSNFFQESLSGQLPSRALPWLRGSTSPTLDRYIASTTYLSLIALALIIAVLLTLPQKSIRIKNFYSKTFTRGSLIAALICLWFFIGIVAFTYLGSVGLPETSTSDIRTIAVAFITLPLPFFFAAERLLKKINKKMFIAPIIIITLVASMYTLYEVAPKSTQDSILTVEDARLEPFTQFVAGYFLQNYFNNTVVLSNVPTVVMDRKISSHVVYILKPNMTVIDLDIATAFDANRIVLFDANGLRYGSIYVSPESYQKASDLTGNQSVIYSSGNITALLINNPPPPPPIQ
jgi:hypothetical protein